MASSSKRTQQSQGFTIVELLIVIVIIAVLAVITVVAYNGVTQRATRTAGTAQLQTLIKKIELAAVETGSYPVTLLDISGKKETDDFVYAGNRYCVSTVVNGQAYSMLNNPQTLQEGSCGNVRPTYPMAPASCFAFNTSTFTITDYYNYQGGDANTTNPACPKEFEVPATISGAAVRIIAQAGFGSQDVKSVVLPDGFTSITQNAFMNSSIEFVYIPNSVTTIADGGFSGTKLKSVYIPDSVTTFNGNRFGSIPTLKSVTMGSDGYAGPAFLDLTAGSFSHNPSLERVKLGRMVRSIESPFYGASNLRELILSTGLEYIDGGVQGSKIEKLAIPGTVTRIRYSGFSSTPTLKSLTIQDGPAELVITNGSFSNTGITSLRLPARVKEITDGSFSLPSLTELVIDEGSVPLLLNNGAFSGTNITSLTLPSRVTATGAAFAGATSLTSLTLRPGITTIGSGAFVNATSLTSVQIPSSVTSIEAGAFAGSGITSVSLPTGITLGTNAFTPGTTITYY